MAAMMTQRVRDPFARTAGSTCSRERIRPAYHPKHKKNLQRSARGGKSLPASHGAGGERGDETASAIAEALTIGSEQVVPTHRKAAGSCAAATLGWAGCEAGKASA